MYMDNDITKEQWLSKQKEYANKLEQLEKHVLSSEQGDEIFINEGKKIIELVKNTYSLYLSQNAEEKKKLLETIFWNITLDGENVHYEYKRPL